MHHELAPQPYSQTCRHLCFYATSISSENSENSVSAVSSVSSLKGSGNPSLMVFFRTNCFYFRKLTRSRYDAWSPAGRGKACVQPISLWKSVFSATFHDSCATNTTSPSNPFLVEAVSRYYFYFLIEKICTKVNWKSKFRIDASATKMHCIFFRNASHSNSVMQTNAL